MFFKKFFILFSIVVVSICTYGQKVPKILPASSKPVKYTVTLNSVYTLKSWDGGNDYQEEIYGAISVCLSAAGFPPTV